MGHLSDCATNSEPAYPVGPCNCGVMRIVESLYAEQERLLASDDEDGYDLRAMAFGLVADWLSECDHAQ